MHQDTALTASQARKLLELAARHNKKAYVMCFDKDVRSKPGRAQLIRVLNERKAEIKPFHHGKTEEIDLSNMQVWKAGNQFDTSEVYEMTETVKFVGGLGPAVKTPLIRTGKFYVISKKMKMIWGGSNVGWVSDIEEAAKYDFDHYAARAVGKINKMPMSSDAEVVTEQQAKDFLGLQMGANVAETIERINVSAMPSNTLPPQMQTPLTIARHPHQAPPAAILPNMVEVPPKPVFAVDSLEFMGMDIAAIINDDTGDELQYLLSQRKQAAVEFAKAKEYFDNSVKKLKDANDKYNAFVAGQSFVPKGLTPSGSKGTKIHNRGLKRAMLIAMSGPNVPPLSPEDVLGKIKGAMPNAELINVNQTLLALKYEHHAERDEATKTWKLTDEGQQEAKRRMADSE